MKSLADNSDQESDTESDTDLDSDDPKPVLQIQQPISHLTSSLSSPPSSSLRPTSPIFLQLPQSVQIQLNRQNQRIAKATAKLQESQLREKQAMDRGDRRNPQRSQKSKDRSKYLARIHAYFTKTVYIPTTWEDAMACPDTKFWQAAWKSELQSIIDRGTFSKQITVPEDHHAITAKIVWDVKYAEDGSITRYKAR